MRTAGLEHLGFDPGALTGLDQDAVYRTANRGAGGRR